METKLKAQVFSNPYKMRASLGTNQANIGTGVVVVNLDTEQYDTNNNFNISTHVYTVPVTGYYEVVASAYLYDVLADQEIVSIFIYKNGGIISSNRVVASKANIGHNPHLTDILLFTIGDTIDMRVNVPNTTTTDIYNEPTFTYMSIHLLSV